MPTKNEWDPRGPIPKRGAHPGQRSPSSGCDRRERCMAHASFSESGVGWMLSSHVSARKDWIHRVWHLENHSLSTGTRMSQERNAMLPCWGCLCPLPLISLLESTRVGALHCPRSQLWFAGCPFQMFPLMSTAANLCGFPQIQNPSLGD